MKVGEIIDIAMADSAITYCCVGFISLLVGFAGAVMNGLEDIKKYFVEEY